MTEAIETEEIEIEAIELTVKQAEVFLFIKEYIEENGLTPSRAEISAEIGVRPNAIKGRIDGMITKGVLIADKTKRRSTVPVKGIRIKIKK